MAKADKNREREDLIAEGHEAWRYLDAAVDAIGRRVERQQGMSAAELADVFNILVVVRRVLDKVFQVIRRQRRGTSDEIRSWDELDREEQERRGW